MAEHDAGHAAGISPDTALFPPAARLTGSRDFARVFKQNQRSKDACFTVLAHKTRDGEPRLGLAIARKNAGNAVQRNRIKRIVRESFRQVRSTLPSADFVVLAGRGVSKRSNPELFDSLSRHWQHLRTARPGRRRNGS